MIGVHAPEFSFEKDIENVRWAAKDMRIQYPIVIDNDHQIWRAFNNEYWPALYFADEQGHIRHQVFGEGQYQQSEAVIQRLLAKAGKSSVPGGVVSVDARGAEADADWTELGSERTMSARDAPRTSHHPAAKKRIRLASMQHPDI